VSVRTLIVCAAASALCAAAATCHAATQTGFLFKTLKLGKDAYRYTVYVPRAHDGSKAWPLIVFLHGSGESGTDGWSPVMQGIGRAIMAAPEKWPFIVIFPQAPTAGDEWEQLDDVVMAMLQAAGKDYKVDKSRLYLTGLSMGGHGAWTLGAAHPDVWAAIAPIAGYADATDPTVERRPLPTPYFTGKPADIAIRLKTMPVWAFHGGADDVVPVKDDEDTVAALKALGNDAKLTVYPKVGHGAWDNAYQTENLAGWFLAHTRKPGR
jgi:predicted peptidase